MDNIKKSIQYISNYKKQIIELDKHRAKIQSYINEEEKKVIYFLTKSNTTIMTKEQRQNVLETLSEINEIQEETNMGFSVSDILKVIEREERRRIDMLRDKHMAKTLDKVSDFLDGVLNDMRGPNRPSAEA